MSVYLFYILTSLLLIKYYFRKKLIKFLHSHEELKFIKEKYINYLIIILLTLIIVISYFNPGSAKEKFKDISDAYNEIVNPEETTRPNPMFDINTYPEDKLW